MSLAPSLADGLLNLVLAGRPFLAPGRVYVALHTEDPGEDGAGEIAHPNYVRLPVLFRPASAGTTASAEAIEWSRLPPVTLTHIGLWDALAGGRFLWGASLEEPRALRAGDGFKIRPGDLAVSID